MPERTPEAPYGCIFVVDQIKKADDVYRELNELMPGKVAVWTTGHDRGSKKINKCCHPSAEFKRNELQNYPVVVVTHAFYNGPKGYMAHAVVRDGTFYSLRERSFLSMSGPKRWSCLKQH